MYLKLVLKKRQSSMYPSSNPPEVNPSLINVFVHIIIIVYYFVLCLLLYLAEMFIYPWHSAVITELVTATTGHMRTSLISLHDEVAVRAPFEMQVLLEEIGPTVIAQTFVCLQHAFRAIFGAADNTFNWLLVKLDIAFTMFDWADSFRWILAYKIEYQNFVVFLLLLLSKVFKVKLRALVNCFRAFCIQTTDELKFFHFSLQLVPNALLAKAMLAVLTEFFHVFFRDAAETYLTFFQFF